MQFSFECHFASNSHSNPTQQKEREKKLESSATAAPEPCAFMTLFWKEDTNDCDITSYVDCLYLKQNSQKAAVTL